MNGVKMLGNLIDKLKEVAAKFPDRVASAIYQEGQIEMTEAKRRCPVSPTAEQARAMGRSTKGVIPGTLRASGTVHEPERKGKNVSVTLSFGAGPSHDYAVPQHEHIEFYHTTGQAKYLESVLNESRASMAGRIAARVHFDRGHE